MKHTKGKWELKEGGNFSGTFVNYINCGHINIAQTRGASYEMTEEENLANAKLITAAPELLEVLTEILELGANNSIKDVIKKAIKNATS